MTVAREPLHTSDNLDLHPFERAQLGKAPFFYVGHEHKVGPIKLADGSECGAPGQPMGVCNYCGQGIADCYHIRSSDKKQFVVGCDCVDKIYREDNVAAGAVAYDDVAQKIKAEKRRIARERRHAREAKQLAANADWFEQNRELLAGVPHPFERNRADGETWVDRIEQAFNRSGTTGKLAIIKEAKKVVDGIDPTKVEQLRLSIVEARQAKIDREAAEKQAQEDALAKCKRDIATNNGWIIEVLESHDQCGRGGFVDSILRDLRRVTEWGACTVGELSQGQQSVLADIYAKQVSGKRRGSKANDAAVDVFWDKVESTHIQRG